MQPTEEVLDELAPLSYLTDGERLVAYLRATMLAELESIEMTTAVEDACISTERGTSFGTALQDLVALNVARRLLAAGRWAVGSFPEDDQRRENYIKSAALNELSLPLNMLTPIYHYVLSAATAADNNISKELYAEVWQYHGLQCYVCGVVTIKNANGPERATVDHLWPQSLGGNSSFYNLLPACDGCNSNREDRAAWSEFWFQRLYLGPKPSENAIKSALGRRARVALQYQRIRQHTADGMSLKRALMLVGPLPVLSLSDHVYPLDFHSMLSPVYRVEL